MQHYLNQGCEYDSTDSRTLLQHSSVIVSSKAELKEFSLIETILFCFICLQLLPPKNLFGLLKDEIATDGYFFQLL